MADHNVKSINQEADFAPEVLQSPVPVVVHFTAAWCGPCKALTPVLDKFAADYQGKVKVARVDIDSNLELTKKYAVKSVPTLIVFHQGQKTGQSVGLTSRENVIRLVGV